MHKKIFFGTVIVILFFGFAELISRIFIFPGSYDYIERRIIEHNLAQRKKAGEYRIFLYGESTMHGGALYPRSVIGKWLRLYLSNLLPEDVMRNVTVVNFGRMGENSSFIADSFAETAAYKPDIAVFYTVHNDFCLVEYRPARWHKNTWAFKKRFEKFCETLPKKSSFLNVLNRLNIRAKIERNKLRDIKLAIEDPWYKESDEPEAFMDDNNLLKPGSSEIMFIAEKFEKNINRIIEVGRRNSVYVIFFEGLSRWKDYEPIKSMHDMYLSEDALSEWNRLFQEAEESLAAGKYNEASALYLRCIDIDPSYALAYYKAAECYERIGKHNKANDYYVLANDKDFFPIRAPSFVNRLYENIRVSDIKGVDVIQTQRLFEQNSPNSIVDERLTMDQIHPSPEGQALMALEIAKIIYNNNLLAPREKWRWEKLRSVDELKKTLGLNSENMFHVYLATAGYLTKHYREEAEYLEEALIIKPKSVFVRSWLAWTYWKMGEKDKAAALYRDLYKEKPDLAHSFLKRHPDIEKVLR